MRRCGPVSTRKLRTACREPKTTTPRARIALSSTTGPEAVSTLQIDGSISNGIPLRAMTRLAMTQRSLSERVARDRRNVRSRARGPNTSSASAHSARASTCGHSSSQRSLVCPDRRRRSCATIASCHAIRRARNGPGPVAPAFTSTIAYGFMRNTSCGAHAPPTCVRTSVEIRRNLVLPAYERPMDQARKFRPKQRDLQPTESSL